MALTLVEQENIAPIFLAGPRSENVLNLSFVGGPGSWFYPWQCLCEWGTAKSHTDYSPGILEGGSWR